MMLEGSVAMEKDGSAARASSARKFVRGIGGLRERGVEMDRREGLFVVVGGTKRC